LSSTMHRAVLSLNHVVNCARLDGTAQAALPPPVVPVANPSGDPDTAYVARVGRTEDDVEAAAPSSARIEYFIFRIEKTQGLVCLYTKEWTAIADSHKQLRDKLDLI
jgi:hypothetical protein